LIDGVERMWLQPLREECYRQFSGIHLPSHDQRHHERVWEHAKKLVFCMTEQGMTITSNELEQLIVAVFFHDQGMSLTTSKEHGEISSRMCQTFMKQSRITAPTPFDKVLEAIEKHDQKDYSEIRTISKKFEIQKFLDTADDLDAFGIIGAYRYLEIYLLRNVTIKTIPDVVMENMKKRHLHFTHNFSHCTPLIHTHKERYIAAKEFFNDMKLQLAVTEYPEDLFIGPIGIVNYTKKEILNNKKDPLTVCYEIKNNQTDPYCLHFFDRLQKELEC